MKYSSFQSFRDFLSVLFTNIDMQRKILRFAQNKDIPDVKAQVLKSVLKTTLHYILPSSCSQVQSEIGLVFTSITPVLFGKINDFYFLLLSITSYTCKPVIICLYVDDNGIPAFTVPVLGNTFNTITQKPYGMDASDEEVCKCITGKTVSKSKYNLEEIMSDLKDNFKIPEHSIFEKLDLDMNCSGIFQFTNKAKKI